MVKGFEARRTKSHNGGSAAVSGLAFQSTTSPPVTKHGRIPLGSATLSVADIGADAADTSAGFAATMTEPFQQKNGRSGVQRDDIDPTPADVQPESQRARVVGYIDGPDAKWRIVGWAQPLPASQLRVDVQLFEHDVELAMARAERFRGDLLEAGIGDGNYGFVLPLSASVFDGLRHKFTVYALAPAGREWLGEIDIALPSRPPAMLDRHDVGNQKAVRLLQNILRRRPANNEMDVRAYANELTRIMKDIVNTYDYATALGLLYVHLLRRRIDDDGLQSRIQRLGLDPDEFSEIIREVLGSDESRARHRGHQELGYPDLAPLIAWTGLRAQG